MTKTVTLIFIAFTCLIYSQSNQTLEGIWKIKDLTIIEEYGRSWDKEFELFNDIIDYEIQFTTDHLFKDRSDSFFHGLDNLKWEVLDSNRNLLIGIKPSHTDEYSLEAVFEIVKHAHSTIFLIYSNTVLELKKVDFNSTGNTYLKTPLPSKAQVFQEIDTTNQSVFNLEALDTVPIFPNCSQFGPEHVLECLITSIKGNILAGIDYSLVKGKTPIDINFIIDNKGNVENINVTSKSESINQMIKLTILNFPKFIPGIKDGTPVLTNYHLEFSLISNE